MSVLLEYFNFRILVYYIAQNSSGENLGELMSFGKENVGKLAKASISYFNKSGIWLGKMLVNNICFAKFTTRVFPTEFFTMAHDGCSKVVNCCVREYNASCREVWIRFDIILF